MEYIGDETGACPQLRNAELDDPDGTYGDVVDFIVGGWADAGLVHGDLSEYNILMRDGEPVVIDVGQAMTADWFNAKDLLRRDIANINRFFASRGADVMPAEEIEKECDEAAAEQEKDGGDEEEDE
jgi:RIO kinase 1